VLPVAVLPVAVLPVAVLPVAVLLLAVFLLATTLMHPQIEATILPITPFSERGHGPGCGWSP